MEEPKEESISKDLNIFKNKMTYIIGGSVAGVLIFLLIIFCTIFSLLNMGNTKIIKGVRINNIDVANLTKEEATNKIQEIVNNKSVSKISLVKDEFNDELDIEALETKYNLDKAIGEAISIGRSGNIIKNNFEILGTKNKGKNINLDIEFKEEKIDEKIEEIQGQIPDAIKESSYYIEESDLIITKGTEGNKIKKEELLNKIRENLNKIDVTEETIEIPVSKEKPEEIDIEKIYNEIHTEAKDAYYTKDPFEIHPHINGVELAISMEEAKKILEEDKQEYVIPLKITVPEITTDKLGSEAFPDQLSTFSTKYDGGNVNRTNNLILASNKINGTVIMPGETFSYNATVGERTISKGYREAKIFQGGKVVDGVGGGICQISSTLYNAVVFANLEVTSRRNHAFITSYLGASRDATVVYGAIDFKFKNTRKYPVKIVSSVGNGVAKISIFGAKEETEYKIDIQTAVTGTIPFSVEYVDDDTLAEGEEIVEQGGANGCRSVAYKVMYLNGNVVSRTLLSSDTYDAMNKIIRRGVAVQQVSAPELAPEVVPEPTPANPELPQTPDPTPQNQENTNQNTVIQNP